MSNKFNEKMIETKSDSSIPGSLQDKVDIILLSKRSSDWTVFGSFMYRIQKYYGDVDVRETLISTKSVNELAKRVAKSLQKMVNEIISKPFFWYSEIKAGLDVRYILDVGVCNDGFYYPNEKFLVIAKEYYDIGLFTNEEYEMIMDNTVNMVDTPLIDSYNIVYNIVRERRILRWTADEINAGKKKLPLGITITLQDAIKMKTHIKIDYITIVNGNFFEITNIMFIGHMHPNGCVSLINVFGDYSESYVYVRQMREETEDIFFSLENVFKGAKRMYALTRSFLIAAEINNQQDKIREYQNFISKLIPLITGDVSYLYQLKSFIGSLLRLYKLKYKIPEDVLMKQIDTIQFALPNILFFPRQLVDELNKVISLFRKNKKAETRRNILMILEDLFMTWINQMSINYLDKNQINPPPSFVFPEKQTYRHVKIEMDKDDPSYLYDIIVEENDNSSTIIDNHGQDLLVVKGVPEESPEPAVLDFDLPGPNYDSYDYPLEEEVNFNDLVLGLNSEYADLSEKEIFNHLTYTYNDILEKDECPNEYELGEKDEQQLIDEIEKIEQEMEEINNLERLAQSDEEMNIIEALNEEAKERYQQSLEQLASISEVFEQPKQKKKKPKKKTKKQMLAEIKKDCKKGDYEALYDLINKN